MPTMPRAADRGNGPRYRPRRLRRLGQSMFRLEPDGVQAARILESDVGVEGAAGKVTGTN